MSYAKNMVLVCVFLFFSIHQYAQNFQKLIQDYYQVEKDTIYSKYYGKGDNRKIVDVYLPFNFKIYPNQKFQVIYLLNSFYPGLDVSLIASKVFGGLLPPTIVVSIQEYNFNIYNDSTDVYFSKSDSLFNNYFTCELIPYIQDHYHTASFKTLVAGGIEDHSSNYAIYLMNHTKLFNAYILFLPNSLFVTKKKRLLVDMSDPYYIPQGAYFKTNYIRQFLQEDTNYHLTVYLAFSVADAFNRKNYIQSIYDSLQIINNHRVNSFLQIEKDNLEHDANIEPYAFAKAIDYIYSDYVKMVWQMQLSGDPAFYYGHSMAIDSVHFVSFDMVKQCWKRYDMSVDISPYVLLCSIYFPLLVHQDTITTKKIIDYYVDKLPQNIAYLAYFATLYQMIGDNEDVIKCYMKAIAKIPQSVENDYHLYSGLLYNLIDVNIINSLYIPLVSLYAKDSNYKTVYQHIESSIPFINPIVYYYLANISFTHHYKLEASIAYLKKWINYLKAENSIKEQPYQYQFDTSVVSNLNSDFPISLMFTNPDLSHSYILLSKLYASIGKEAEARKYALLGERVE